MVVWVFRKIDQVEATLDQIRDQVEDHEEVSLAMSEGIGQNDFIDEGELEDELAELEMEVCRPLSALLVHSSILTLYVGSRRRFDKFVHAVDAISSAERQKQSEIRGAGIA